MQYGYELPHRIIFIHAGHFVVTSSDRRVSEDNLLGTERGKQRMEVVTGILAVEAAAPVVFFYGSGPRLGVSKISSLRIPVCIAHDAKCALDAQDLDCAGVVLLLQIPEDGAL